MKFLIIASVILSPLLAKASSTTLDCSLFERRNGKSETTRVQVTVEAGAWKNFGTKRVPNAQITIGTEKSGKLFAVVSNASGSTLAYGIDSVALSSATVDGVIQIDCTKN
jgi:hypothetical protein